MLNLSYFTHHHYNYLYANWAHFIENIFLLPDHSKLMLEGGRGASFLVEPERGFLGPYQSQEITVFAYSDMWGEYEDTLSCHVEGGYAEIFSFFAN